MFPFPENKSAHQLSKMRSIGESGHSLRPAEGMKYGIRQTAGSEIPEKNLYFCPRLYHYKKIEIK